jgi:alpha-amylase/alpha-mannosidase (GH57 family)
LLIDEGLRFVILAPQQAKRVRSGTGIPASPEPADEQVPAKTNEVLSKEGRTGKPVLPGDWQTVAPGSIDTSVAYSYFHHDGSGRSIAVFFYDPELAQAIAFEQALTSSASLVERFAQRTTGVGSLVNVATDGETYGHHHKFGELCLAYALEVDAPARGFAITNYGDFLDRHPPELEVEISNGELGEGSSWSCVHGVGRWIRDCGCHTGGEPGWNQAWRGPLRDALDFLRDEAAAAFEATRGELFNDPWMARDDAIQLVLDAQKSREEFLWRHAPRELTQEEQRRALLFLELQRNALLMYTSCGWFFNDISGIEPVQILKYAARAIDLMNQLELPSPRERFLEILSAAKSNRREYGNGADIYRRLVEPSNPSFKANEETLASTIA